MTNKTTSADGTTIAYDQVGAGPAVICVGGALNDRGSTGQVAAGLADRFCVYSYDRRGRGESGDTQPYAVEREIEDLAAMIEVAGGSARVYGMSSGAVLVLRAAAAGVRMERLGLFEPPLTAGVPDAPDALPAYDDELAEYLAADRRADALKLFMVKVVGMPPQFADGPAAVPGLQAIAHTLRYDAAVMTDAVGRAPADVPTAVLVGGNSPAWMHAAAASVGGEVRVLPDQTHNVDQAVLATALGEFFA